MLLLLMGSAVATVFVCMYGCATDQEVPAQAAALEPGTADVPSLVEGVPAQPRSLPPLEVDADAPLLLDEPGDAEKASPGTAKEILTKNQACFVCHVNYKEDPLVAWHASAEIGCTACHGTSYPHRNDENNTTPPDVMYPARKVDALCRKCHETHDAPAGAVIARWLERHPGKTDPKGIVCTDCHGDHRLKLRSVRWDKDTGELLTGKKHS